MLQYPIVHIGHGPVHSNIICSNPNTNDIIYLIGAKKDFFQTALLESYKKKDRRIEEF